MKAREGGGGTRDEPLLDGQNEECPASGVRGTKKEEKKLVTPVEKRCRKAGSGANTLCHVSLHLGEVEKRVSALISFPFLCFRPVATRFFTAERNQDLPSNPPSQRHACALTCVNAAAGTEALQTNTALPIRRSRRSVKKGFMYFSSLFGRRRSIIDGRPLGHLSAALDPSLFLTAPLRKAQPTGGEL